MLLQEKADQVQGLLAETGLDCWLSFGRETGLHFEPGVDLVVGCDLTWTSAFLFTRGSERIAIVGRHDAAMVRATGVFKEVIGYDQGIRQTLVEVLTRLEPEWIGLNYSTDDSTADGLTYGMWVMLNDLLRGTPFTGRLTSAAPLLARLRARKTPTEVERIRGAVAVTEEIAGLITGRIQPGVSEADISAFVHEEFRRRALASAWDWDACPIVNSGPASAAGHGKPRADIQVEPGHLVHVDLGVSKDGYCSDLQRMWYVRRPGEQGPPENIGKAFATVIRAIEAGAKALRPGVRGHEVDAAARAVVVGEGYPEYKHALGHSVGRAVHDGGTLLGPRWERYGQTPDGRVEVGNVYTLELGLDTEAGYVGIEEDVVVTAGGCEFLSSFQKEIMLVG
jgi:Xaa-Pro aminopeptidase